MNNWLCRISGHQWRCHCGARYTFPHGSQTFSTDPNVRSSFKPCDERWACKRCGAKGDRS